MKLWMESSDVGSSSLMSAFFKSDSLMVPVQNSKERKPKKGSILVFFFSFFLRRKFGSTSLLLTFVVEVQVIEASLYRFVAVAAFLESELLRIIQLCLESLLNMRPRERGESQRSGGLRLHLEYPVYRPPLDGATHRQAPLRNPRCTNRHHRQGQVAAFTCLSLSLSSSSSSSLSRVFLSLSLSLSLSSFFYFCFLTIFLRG